MTGRVPGRPPVTYLIFRLLLLLLVTAGIIVATIAALRHDAWQGLVDTEKSWWRAVRHSWWPWF